MIKENKTLFGLPIVEVDEVVEGDVGSIELGDFRHYIRFRKRSIWKRMWRRLTKGKGGNDESQKSINSSTSEKARLSEENKTAE